jgi:hypothetical protein
VKLERPPAWTEYKVLLVHGHNDHSGASLASFTATPWASDFEAAARRVGHAFHILTALYARQLFLRDIATSPLVFNLVVMVTNCCCCDVVFVASAEYGLAEAISVVVLTIVTVECIPIPKSWSPEIGWPSGLAPGGRPF